MMRSRFGLENHGIKNVSDAWWTLSTPALYEHAVRRREGMIAHLGPLVVRTGHFTGRSPQDKFIVDEPSSRDKVWWGEVNHPIAEAQFERLLLRMRAYLQGRDIYIQDCFAGADPKFRVPLRVISTTAWHSLFARNMFIQATKEQLDDFVPQLTVIHSPQFHAVPEEDGTHSEAFIVVHLGRKTILVGGTSYAGELKKAVFSVLTYLYPPQGALPMHAAANMGANGDVALFFGLSGTGKTSLSVTSDRRLIGDDEHGWSQRGVFAFEGGCYAKVVGLSREAEPEIFETTRRFGTILENVAIDSVTRRLDLNDTSLTENTRGSYPLSHLPNVVRDGLGGLPNNIIMLTADAFGVMPPIAKLTSEQAMYHFLSGYTAKVGGTEQGVHEPKATFSPCFGAPFMTLHPKVYAELLGEKISSHKVQVWLVNTGWTGGAYGVGHRIKIAYTRAMVKAALEGKLDQVPSEMDPVFGMQVPTSCPGVPPEVLRTRGTWADAAAYDAQAKKLVGMFLENFKQFEGQVSMQVQGGGPVLLGKQAA